ncbi:MAG: phage scaffolding protein [Lachnospiraceae bacterium]|jgi:hypothetical protein
MKTEDLKAQGLTDTQITFVMAENGKDITKIQREKDTLTTERDNWKSKAETAEKTLKKFEGIDPEQIKTELADWKKKAEDAENDYNAKLYERDFADALKTALDEVQFSSTAAKKSIMADIKEAGLKLKDGKILGLNDLLAQMKESDASAFVDENQQQAQKNQAKFTQPVGKKPPANGKKYNMQELMKMKNENPGLDITQYMQ